MAAVTKQAVLSKLSSQDARIYAKEESSLNARLEQFDGAEVWYSVQGCSKRVINMLFENFRAAGWDVRYHEQVDQRDEAALILK